MPQKAHRLVQRLPRIRKDNCRLEKQTPVFGQADSRQTVFTRSSESVPKNSRELRTGKGWRSHSGSLFIMRTSL